MNMHGIIRADKHSFYDFGAILTARTIGYPTQNKVTETVPYSQNVYDFSNLYGGKVYSERQLTYELSIAEPTVPKRIKLNHRVNLIVNWLSEGNGKSSLIDTYTPEYHYNAELASISVAFGAGWAKITAVFNAYPFKIPNDPNSELVEVL
jgi:hypothetical protein